MLDTFDDHAFLAVAMVQTQGLRSAGIPKSFGQDFVLAGYRVIRITWRALTEEPMAVAVMIARALERVAL